MKLDTREWSKGRYTVCHMVDEGWAVLIDGIQWAPTGEKRDNSGAGDWTVPTMHEAIAMAKKLMAEPLEF
jgi:hypothetical protein